ncbi:exodeoxyribonuclease V subunit gamma [Thauera phenolivorans]|nr:exodeoxyribonuclease V subunit gamma [Thauera phenolivorans]
MSSSIEPGFIALHGNRTEVLMDTVAAWLRQHPLAPLEQETILVQSNGMAEWVKMSLAREAGVCAAAAVSLPARFMWRSYRQILGHAAVPPSSALDEAPLTWRLMRLLPGLLDDPAFAPVAGYLRADDDTRLWQLAARIADLFDQYQVYRPDWLEQWATGHDRLVSAAGVESAVPPDQAWQPALWRRLLGEVDEDARAAIRPRLHRRVLAALEDGRPFAAPLPRRIVLFGMTHVPLPTLELLAALSRHSQVMLAVPNPCRFHWADIIDGREWLRSARRRQPDKPAAGPLDALPLEQMHLHAHPLLAAWGRQARDFVRQLDAFDDAEQARARFSLPRIDLFDEDGDEDESGGEAAGTPLLRQVHAHIRDLVPLCEHPRLAVAADDRSIVFHIAHGPVRELEVLHDQLLALLAHPPGGRPLHPRDIVVMVPAIDDFAPAIRAVFGQYGRHDPRHIPFDIADLSARAASPLVGALEWLLRLPGERARLSELCDLLEVPAIAARFGIDAAALPRLTQWMRGAGIRWGLDAAHRAALQLATCGEQNSARFGVNRMLMGFAMGESGVDGGEDAGEPFADIEPYAEVGGLDAELAGGFARLLECLLRWRDAARQPAPPDQWARRCRTLLAKLVDARELADQRTLGALDDALEAWTEACREGGFDGELPLAVAAGAWLSALESPSLNKRFRAGGVTFCTLMPMRAIPFEVVCLLGMNDGDYPRRAPRSDFDLMGVSGQARPGDRARRDDDRQLMLEALLSARRVFYASWSGRSVRDNSEQPPSVLVSQLRDYLAAGWGAGVVASRTTEHPLQPFSRRYFEPGAALFTYAREWRAAHAADADEPAIAAAVPPLAPFEPDPRTPLTVAQLASFLRNPVKAFFRQRLAVRFEAAEEAPVDEEAFGFDALEEYGLVAELAQAVLAASAPGEPLPPGAALEARLRLQLGRLRRAGRLPMGGFGARSERELEAVVLPLLHAWQAALAAHPRPLQRQRLHFEAAGGRMEDWLDQLHAGAEADAPPTWLALDSARLLHDPKKQDLRADRMLLPWVRSLLAAAGGLPARGLVVGRDASVAIAPLAAEPARATLARLLQAWREGLDAPLPLPLRTALAQLEGAHPQRCYEGHDHAHGEVEEACLARLYPDFEALSADGRFAELAERLYAPLRDWIAAHTAVLAHPDPSAASEERRA